RRGHDKEVRRGLAGAHGAVLQGGSLHDTEAMLLVHDGETEGLEPDAFLDKGMRADNDIDLARCNRVGDALLLGGPRRAGEKLDVEAAARGSDLTSRPPLRFRRGGVCSRWYADFDLAQEAGEGLEVLFRQDFRRRH